MRKPVCVFLVAVMSWWSSAAAAQDLFERALSAMADQVMTDAGLDHGGVLLRGGFEVGYPAATGEAGDSGTGRRHACWRAWASATG